MKAMVIIGASIRVCPYAMPYIKELLDAGYDVTAMVWIRDNMPDIDIDERVRVVRYKKELDDAVSKKAKIGSFLGFRSFLMKELKKKYDFVAVMDTQFAVLVSDCLLRKYKGKFLFDMRDLSFESIGLYRKRVAKIVEASSVVFISSDAYRKYLPQSDKIYTTHNIQPDDMEFEGIRTEKTSGNPIRISFWGMIRDVRVDSKLIEELGNDERFELHYYGILNNRSEALVEKCKQKNYTNVWFHGRYEKRDRYEFAKNTDLIHNMYSNPADGSNPAMGNKYYDGIIFRIPQIGIENGYMAERALAKNVGLTVRLEPGIGDRLYEYYNSMDWDTFDESCRKELAEVVNEYNSSAAILKEVIRKKVKIKAR